MADNIRGFAFCNKSTPVNENPKGLSIGGTRGAKKTIIHNRQSWRNIKFCDIKCMLAISDRRNCIAVENIYTHLIS
jgi:hypothetical protein